MKLVCVIFDVACAVWSPPLRLALASVDGAEGAMCPHYVGTYNDK